MCYTSLAMPYCTSLNPALLRGSAHSSEPPVAMALPHNPSLLGQTVHWAGWSVKACVVQLTLRLL